MILTTILMMMKMTRNSHLVKIRHIKSIRRLIIEREKTRCAKERLAALRGFQFYHEIKGVGLALFLGVLWSVDKDAWWVKKNVEKLKKSS